MVDINLCVTAKIPNDPCTPSPCGPGAICRARGTGASCECEPGLRGDPYSGCRPECLADSDCSPSRACIRSHCRDPCQGTCGVEADCETVNHIPLCSCPSGTRGNAFERCDVITSRMYLDWSYIYLLSISNCLLNIYTKFMQLHHAVPLHVDRAPCARLRTVTSFARVQVVRAATRLLLAAGPSASSAQNVHETAHACVTSASILASVHVALMLYAECLTMPRFAHAHLTPLEIHSTIACIEVCVFIN